MHTLMYDLKEAAVLCRVVLWIAYYAYKLVGVELVHACMCMSMCYAYSVCLL